MIQRTDPLATVKERSADVVASKIQRRRSVSPVRPFALRRCGSFQQFNPTEKVGNATLELRKRRGVVPYVRCADGSIAVLLGIDAKSGQVTDFGGYADVGDATPIDTAARELEEETIGVLSATADSVACGGYSISVLVFAVDVTEQVPAASAVNADSVCVWFSSKFARARADIMAEMTTMGEKKPSRHCRVRLENSGVFAIPIEMCEQFAFSTCVNDFDKVYPVSDSVAAALGEGVTCLPRLYSRIRGAVYMAMRAIGSLKK